MAQRTLTSCNACGVASELHAAFQNEPNSIRKFCPLCWKERDEANDRIYLLTYISLGVLGIVLASMNSLWGFLLLTFFLFHVFGIVGTVPHELGHALAARALHLHVFQVVVGVGKKLFECRLFGVLVEFRTIPYGGFTLALPTGGERFRSRHFIYALAGPLANLIVALAILVIAGRDRIADFRPHEKISPWSLLFASNALIFASNLIPRAYVSGASAIVSDGLHLIRALTMKKEDIDQLRVAGFIAHCKAARESGNMRAAAQWIERGLAEFPDDRALLTEHGTNLIEAQRFDEARALFKKLLQESDADDLAARALLMNDVAYADALLGGEELEADEYSDYALKILPWSAAIKGTRGTVLVQRGQLAEGIALLEISLREAEERWGRTQNACVLAIAEARRGNREAASNYLKLARELQPDCFLLAQAEQACRSASGETWHLSRS